MSVKQTEVTSTVTVTLDDLPEDIKELIDIGIFTEEEALSRMCNFTVKGKTFEKKNQKKEMDKMIRNNMQKSELRCTDVVLSSKGSYGIVLRDTPKGDLIKWFKNNKGEIIHKYRSLDMINNDLTFKYDGKDNRIIKVYRVTDPHDMSTMNAIDEKYLIYEEKIKEVTMSDIEKLYGCKVKIVADKSVNHRNNNDEVDDWLSGL